MTIVINSYETHALFTWGGGAVTTKSDSKLNKNTVIFPLRLFR